MKRHGLVTSPYTYLTLISRGLIAYLPSQLPPPCPFIYPRPFRSHSNSIPTLREPTGTAAVNTEIMCPSDRILRSACGARSGFRSAFDVLDADRDGKISGDDLRMFYAGFPGSGSADVDDVIGSMMLVADFNNDGFVEYDEFERVLRGYNGKSTFAARSGCAGVMEDVFRVMDKDGDGRLSREDLKSYMDWAGFPATDEDIVAMIRLAGGDEKQGVPFDGLLKVFGW